MARDLDHCSAGVNRTADGQPSELRSPGSPREHHRAVLDALRDGGGRLSVEALARDVAEDLPTEGLDSADEPVQCVLLAHVLPPLLAEGRIAFSPERLTVSLAGTDSSGRRTLLPGGVVSVALVALVASAPDPSSSTFLGAVGLALLCVLYLGKRRIRRWRDRVPGSSSGPGASNPADGTRSATSTDVAAGAAGPEQRILAHLLAGGGRLRQQTLIDRLGRSKSTVSRHVSSLAEAGLVAKVPVGRENLVCLPSALPADGSGPDAASSVTRPDAGD